MCFMDWREIAKAQLTESHALPYAPHAHHPRQGYNVVRKWGADANPRPQGLPPP